MEKKIQVTTVLQKNLAEYKSQKNRLILNEGGTGSSKTYSLAQLFAIIMMTEVGVQITISRKTLPALRATAMKDFFNVLKIIGAYREDWHNKSENTYTYVPTGSIVDFVSVDDPMRIRSRRRDFLWLNEANEFTLEDYRQFSMRTNKQIYLDYNPSHQFHWIYDELQPKKNCVIIKSSYIDNPFLHTEVVKEIESYKDKDKNYWKIYGLGERGMAETLIYTHWQFCDKIPDDANVFYGLDFGYNNQTALVKVGEKDKDYFWEELLYERYLTNQDLVRDKEEVERTGKPLGKLWELVEQGKLKTTDDIYADNNEPARIEEISQAGFNISPCQKGEVKDGIDIIKSRGFYITKNSLSILKEAKTYSWKEKDGKSLEEPVKQNDHCLVGNTKIIMSNGKQKLLKNIKIGEMVRTYRGVNRVLLSRLTRKKADIIELTLSNGYKLKGTPDHKIFTDRGMITIDALRYDDTIKILNSDKISLWKKQLFSTIKNITGTVSIIYQLVDIKMEKRDYIKQFGKVKMEKYQKDFTYITKILIQQIIYLTILNLLKLKNIYQIILKEIGNQKSLEKKLEKILILLDTLQKNGIHLPLELNGTENTVKNVGLVNNQSILKYVKFVEKNIKHIIPNNQDFVIRIVRRKHCEREDVYNLTVENEHNYYANKILVKNCLDSGRYAIVSEQNKYGHLQFF